MSLFINTKTNTPKQSCRTNGHSQISEDSPFCSKAKVQRSPIGETAKLSSNELKSNDETFDKLGDLIVDLMEYVKNRNNVHSAIKEKVVAIRATYNKVRDGRVEPSKPRKTTNCATQTSPQKNEAKRLRDTTDEFLNTETPKRMRNGSPKSTKPIPRDNRSLKAPITVKEVQKPLSTWTTVARKKTRRKTKPDTMIICAKGDVTYADMLRKIKTDPKLVELGKEVNKVRRTQKGDLLLELKSDAKNIAEKFNEKIATSLEGQAEIKTHSEEIMLECKDLDDITTKQEVCLAFRRELQLPKLEETSVKSIRKSFGGTQTAKICLPVEAARRALEMGRIKIGWSSCRIKEIVKVTMCYRCLEYGHIARSCKALNDRSKQCRRCGADGHFSKECTAEPNCMLCKANDGTDLKHIAGTYKCPIFRKALSSGPK